MRAVASWAHRACTWWFVTRGSVGAGRARRGSAAACNPVNGHCLCFHGMQCPETASFAAIHDNTRGCRAPLGMASTRAPSYRRTVHPGCTQGAPSAGTMGPWSIAVGQRHSVRRSNNRVQGTREGTRKEPCCQISGRAIPVCHLVREELLDLPYLGLALRNVMVCCPSPRQRPTRRQDRAGAATTALDH